MICRYMLIQILAKRSEPINSSLPSNELINKIERRSWNNVYEIYERYPLFYRWYFSPRKVGQTEGNEVRELNVCLKAASLKGGAEWNIALARYLDQKDRMETVRTRPWCFES